MSSVRSIRCIVDAVFLIREVDAAADETEEVIITRLLEYYRAHLRA